MSGTRVASRSVRRHHHHSVRNVFPAIAASLPPCDDEYPVKFAAVCRDNVLLFCEGVPPSVEASHKMRLHGIQLQTESANIQGSKQPTTSKFNRLSIQQRVKIASKPKRHPANETNKSPTRPFRSMANPSSMVRQFYPGFAYTPFNNPKPRPPLANRRKRPFLAGAKHQEIKQQVYESSDPILKLQLKQYQLWRMQLQRHAKQQTGNSKKSQMEGIVPSS